MNRSTTAARFAAAAMALAVLTAPVALAGSASAAPAADTVIAADPTPAPPPAPAAPMVQRTVGIDASIVGGLVVSGAKGAMVTVTARGEKARTVTPKGAAPAVFRQLTPGVTYTVAIGGIKVGTGVPVSAVGGAYGLTVSTTGTPDEVLLRWSQTPAKGQGAISFDVVATPIGTIGRSTEASTVAGTTTATVTTMALDRGVKYTLSVTPRNSASTGKTTAATMTRTLAEMGGASIVPTTPAPAPAAAPAAVPSTTTIYVCPAGTVPNGDLCRSTVAYTITVKDYTFHKVAIGPAPMLDSYETTAAACPGGYSYENYNWVAYCRLYGPAPTTDVKDATPAGFTDTGTHWTSKGTAPAGYTDDGTAWVKDAAKVPTVVPA